MARWLTDATGFPEELYPGASPGWVAGCISWLDNHPGERLPFGPGGSDACDVYRIAVELASAFYEPVSAENCADQA